MNFQKKFAGKSGYSLIEMIIYIAVLSVVSFLIANTLLSFVGGYRNILAMRKIDNSAIDVMERITREIHFSTQIDDGNSVFGTNPGVLTLVRTVDGNSTTTKFYLQNGVVKIDVDGIYLGPLTLFDTTVDCMEFNKTSGQISDAVKIDLTVSGTSGTVTKTKSYHSTVVLKKF